MEDKDAWLTKARQLSELPIDPLTDDQKAALIRDHLGPAVFKLTEAIQSFGKDNPTPATFCNEVSSVCHFVSGATPITMRLTLMLEPHTKVETKL